MMKTRHTFAIYFLTSALSLQVTLGNEASCASCSCTRRDMQSCVIRGTNCLCREGKWYDPYTQRCLLTPDTCGLTENNEATFRANNYCTRCTCINGEPSCPVAASFCKCMNGTLMLPDGRCAAERDPTCGFYNSDWEDRHRCANCSCPGDSNSCFPFGGECKCVNRTLYYPNGTCAFSNREGCPTEQENLNDEKGCRKCRCEHDEPYCLPKDVRCICRDNILYLPDGQCARGSGNSCLDMDVMPNAFEQGYQHCAKCKCPMEDKFCKIFGYRCDCVGGVLLFSGTISCPLNETECIEYQVMSDDQS